MVHVFVLPANRVGSVGVLAAPRLERRHTVAAFARTQLRLLPGGTVRTRFAPALFCRQRSKWRAPRRWTRGRRTRGAWRPSAPNTRSWSCGAEGAALLARSRPRTSNARGWRRARAEDVVMLTVTSSARSKRCGSGGAPWLRARRPESEARWSTHSMSRERGRFASRVRSPCARAVAAARCAGPSRSLLRCSRTTASRGARRDLGAQRRPPASTSITTKWSTMNAPNRVGTALALPTHGRASDRRVKRRTRASGRTLARRPSAIIHRGLRPYVVPVGWCTNPTSASRSASVPRSRAANAASVSQVVVAVRSSGGPPECDPPSPCAGDPAVSFVETRERLVGLLDVESFVARHTTVVTEAAELEGLLERTAAGPIVARRRSSEEQRVGREPEHVVDARDDVLGDLPQAPNPAQVRLGAAHRLESEAPVVDVLDRRCHDRTEGLGLEHLHDHRDGARRRGGALARRSFGKDLGVALVHARHGVGEASRARRSRSAGDRPSRRPLPFRLSPSDRSRRRRRTCPPCESTPTWTCAAIARASRRALQRLDRARRQGPGFLEPCLQCATDCRSIVGVAPVACSRSSLAQIVGEARRARARRYRSGRRLPLRCAGRASRSRRSAARADVQVAARVIRPIAPLGARPPEVERARGASSVPIRPAGNSTRDV